MKKNVYVIGIGPGSRDEMTFRAACVLKECDVIAGYQTYIDLIRDDYPDKEYIITGMTKETDRCRMALERAQQGASVALISSGDAGVYGMAGLIYQLGVAYPDVDITVIPGIAWTVPQLLILSSACTIREATNGPIISRRPVPSS